MTFFSMKAGSMRGLVLVMLAIILVCVMEPSALAKSKKTSQPPAPAIPADPVTGLWYTQDHDGGIELFSCENKICGRFYWLKDDEQNGDISHDTHNPDPEKQARPLCRLQFMSGFVPDGNGKYTDGTIYSPRHGADFSAEMTLVDHDTLHLRGYLVSPLLGQTQTWTRADPAAMPKCSTTHNPPAG